MELISSVSAIALLNGKLKPVTGKSKHSVPATLGVVVMILLAILCAVMAFDGFMSGSIKYFTGGVMGVCAFIYLLMIVPYFQKDSYYDIQLVGEDKLERLRVFYKGKEVVLLYGIDKDGKVYFKNDKKKTDGIGYYDESHMSVITKYKIVNYVTWFLGYYDILAKDSTHVSFE